MKRLDRRRVMQGLAGGALLALGSRPVLARERVLGGPCMGCEWVFDGRPARLASHTRIAPPGEPGAPMTLEGIVRTSRGRAASGVVVYAYHTDSEGIYPAAGNRHGRLRGWAITDADGHYRFDSIRPAAYPGQRIAEHVHMHVIEPGVGTYYVDNVVFEDDALLTDADRRAPRRGGSGITQPEKRDGVWQVTRDIVLGMNIPGY